MTNKWIAGAGGGGGGKGGRGGGGSADVAKDNLDSYQIARIIDLLCEGEIEGFPSASDIPEELKHTTLQLLKRCFL